MGIGKRVSGNYCGKEVKTSLNCYPVCIMFAIAENEKCKCLAISFHLTLGGFFRDVVTLPLANYV